MKKLAFLLFAIFVAGSTMAANIESPSRSVKRKTGRIQHNLDSSSDDDTFVSPPKCRMTLNFGDSPEEATSWDNDDLSKPITRNFADYLATDEFVWFQDSKEEVVHKGAPAPCWSSISELVLDHSPVAGHLRTPEDVAPGSPLANDGLDDLELQERKSRSEAQKKCPAAPIRGKKTKKKKAAQS